MTTWRLKSAVKPTAAIENGPRVESLACLCFGCFPKQFKILGICWADGRVTGALCSSTLARGQSFSHRVSLFFSSSSFSSFRRLSPQPFLFSACARKSFCSTGVLFSFDAFEVIPLLGLFDLSPVEFHNRISCSFRTGRMRSATIIELSMLKMQ